MHLDSLTREKTGLNKLQFCLPDLKLDTSNNAS